MDSKDFPMRRLDLLIGNKKLRLQIERRSFRRSRIECDKAPENVAGSA